MRVVQLGPYPPPHGGVQSNLVAIRELLLRRGDSCPVINLHRHRTGRGEDVCHPRTAAETLKVLARARADIAHLHLGGDVTARLLGLAAVVTGLPGTRAVLTFHSGGYASSEAGRTARRRTLRGLVFRRFDRVIAVNEEIAALFGRFGVEKNRLKLIAPHALPQRPEAELPRELKEFYAAHNPVLVSVGLLEEEYDLPLQMEALRELRREFPRAGLALLGSGSLESDLRRRIDARPDGLLLAGDVPHEATLKAIADADMLLRTTVYDGDSVAVREALHLGTPVIASDNRMRPAGVILIPARDRAALCAAVRDGLRRPRPARNGARPDESNIQAVLDLYDELLRS